MRNTMTKALLAALLLIGCGNSGPKTTERVDKLEIDGHIIRTRGVDMCHCTIVRKLETETNEFER